MVPASRPARHLDFAIDLAYRSGATFVALCSGEAEVEAVRGRYALRPATRAVIVRIGPGYAIPGFAPLTSTEPDLVTANAGRSSDLSVKRNVGLLLARMTGWDNVVYLDDDIYRVSPARIGTLVGQLSRFPVAGMAAEDFPDNSVVCHANRLSGNVQDVMVSGSLLAVDCSRRSVPFFPDIYNEDWLFFHEFAARGQLGYAGLSQQLLYDPFEDPGRAEREEFGDLLAEGLFTFFHDVPAYADEAVVLPRVEYWDEFREVRRRFIEDALDAFDRHNTFDSRAIRSLESAREQLGKITSANCVLFLDLLCQDRARWDDVFKQAPTGLTIPEALDRLELLAVVI